jgi:hypothetical protein
MTCAVVLKNADFTEGRGPMRFHKVFATLEAAETYVKKQEGIFGSPQVARPERYVFSGVEHFGWNGYDIYPNVEIES